MSTRAWISRFAGASLVGAAVLWLCMAPGPVGAQTFAPVKPYSVSGAPLQLGYINLPNTTTTVYFPQGDGGQRSGTVVAGTNTAGIYDALGWFSTRNASCQNILLPPGWFFIGGAIYQYYVMPPFPQPPNPVGQILIKDLNGNTLQNTVWGQYLGDCEYPLFSQAVHQTGGANAPVAKPDLPEEASTPCPDNQCADPVSMMTGLYYQEDTDIEVPDVLPIRLTRTYRTKDVGVRVFGIGASHPYE